MSKKVCAQEAATMSESDDRSKIFGLSPFEKFTEKARKALALAQEEAQALLQPSIGTEHLLLGVMRVSDGVGAKALAEMGLDMEKLRGAMYQTMAAEHQPPREPQTVVEEIGLTPRAKKAIELAVQEARLLKHHYIGTEHLLLGLIHEEQGTAAKALALFGVTAGAARAQVLQMLTGKGRDAAPAGPKSNVITCRVEDRDLDAIDALIEAGIRSTRSDAASWLISAGIQANQPLFERVNATVTEIRRLRAEAQELAQEISSSRLE
jgi:ATP-dependent Clp protease ATP-binding subunit ClpA